jgi:hypothetical protein
VQARAQTTSGKARRLSTAGNCLPPAFASPCPQISLFTASHRGTLSPCVTCLSHSPAILPRLVSNLCSVTVQAEEQLFTKVSMRCKHFSQQRGLLATDNANTFIKDLGDSSSSSRLPPRLPRPSDPQLTHTSHRLSPLVHLFFESDLATAFFAFNSICVARQSFRHIPSVTFNTSSALQSFAPDWLVRSASLRLTSLLFVNAR